MPTLNLYTGSVWSQIDPATLQYYSGSSFHYGGLKYWDGASWILVPAMGGPKAIILYSNENHTIFGPIVNKTITANRSLYGAPSVYGGDTYNRPGTNATAYTGEYLPRIAMGGKGGGRVIEPSQTYWYYGGNGAIGAGGSGCVGHSTSGTQISGHGGGLLIISAQAISGSTITARGGNYINNYDRAGGGGGGSICIFTEQWDAHNTVNVDGGLGRDDYGVLAQAGGIVLWKKNLDGTKTLMAGIEQGAAITQARLNALHGVESGAPAPVNGTNFSIPFTVS